MIPVVRQKTVYRGFGLRMASDIALPELVPDTGRQEADVEIRRETLTEGWKACGAGDSRLAYRNGELWLNIPGVAIYRIRNGREIAYCPAAGAEERWIRLYLLGSCMGALLLQRKILPLHGSAVVMHGKAYAFVGESGAGKSTLAAALVRRGCPLLTDDVIPVSFFPDRVPAVVPAYPMQKLWLESLEQLGLDRNRYLPVHDAKYAVPVSSRFCHEPVPLAGVFELAASERERVELIRHEGLERLCALQYHTFRPVLVARMGLEQWHFDAIARIAGQVRMYQLRRPAGRFSVDELADRVLDAAQSA